MSKCQNMFKSNISPTFFLKLSFLSLPFSPHSLRSATFFFLFFSQMYLSLFLSLSHTHTAISLPYWCQTQWWHRHTRHTCQRCILLHCFTFRISEFSTWQQHELDCGGHADSGWGDDGDGDLLSAAMRSPAIAAQSHKHHDLSSLCFVHFVQ